jgi:tetratricopeptide (TPR) repeat protein
MLKKMIAPVMLAALPFLFCCCDRAENGKDNSDVITGMVFDSTKANAQLSRRAPAAQWAYLQELVERSYSNQKMAETWLLGRLSQLGASSQDSMVISRVETLADAAKSDLFRSKILHRLGYICADRGDNTRAAGVFRTALALAEKEQEAEMQVMALIGIAATHYNLLRHDSAVIYLEQGKSIAEAHNLTKRIPDLYSNIANNKNLQGQNLEAVKMFVKAANLYKERGDLENLAIIYNNIGVVFLDMKRYPKAVEYFNLARDINEKIKQVGQLMINYGNLGLAYKNQDSISQAKSNYLKSKALSEEAGDEFELSRNYYNLGNLVIMEEKYAQAEMYFDSAAHYCKKNNISYGLMLLEMARSELYSRAGKPQQAIETGLKAMEDLQAYDMPYEKASLSKVLYGAYKATGNIDKALYYFEKYVEISEKLAGSESLKIIWDFENQYEKEKNARQISELEKDVIRQQAHKNIMFLLLASVLLLLIAGGFFFVQYRRNAAIQAELERERYENMKESMMAKGRELTGKALLIAHMNEQMELIRKQIVKLTPHYNHSAKEALQELIQTIEKNKSTRAWDEFEENLAQINSNLYKKLLAIDPSLTPTELQICGFIAQNQSTKDIATLTNRGIQTVSNIRYTLRKKLNLSPEDNLAAFIRAL